MWIVYWLALAVFATYCTHSYAITAPKTRVYLTASGASVAWSILAITAPAVTALTDNGETVSMAAPLELQLFITGLAVFSLLIVVLFYSGHYPPESASNDPTDADRRS